MKNLFLILLTIGGLNVTAQTSNYISFPKVDGYWIYQYYGDQGQPGAYTEYYTEEDTIINNKVYQKLMLTGLDYAGAYRDSNRVVYFIPDTSNVEYMLYDFNLEVGDTIVHPFGGAACSNDTVWVELTDSILISGNYHKTIVFSSMAEWIEGIGSQNYLLNPYENRCLSGNDILRCMMNDSSLIWGASNSFCITSVKEAERLSGDFKLYPNPTNTSFKIQLNSGTIQEVEVVDITGRVIIVKQQINTSQIEINKLPRGIYFVKILDNTGSISVKRIVSTK